MIRRLLMSVTDFGMLIYWAITAAMALGIAAIPSEWLFKDYYDARVVAWNWSFFPLDILLSLTGLWALHLERHKQREWRIWSAVSMTLTVCAGLMAISYWSILGDFDLAWWAPNLFLMLWPLPFLYLLARDFGKDDIV